MKKSKVVLLLVVLCIVLIGLLIWWKLSSEEANLNEAEINSEDYDYDVVVIGGEPEGVAAAVSAARNGAKTLLIEDRDGLGGLMTFGMLNFIDMVQGEEGVSVVEGIFEEWHQMVGGDNAFGIVPAKEAFLQLVKDEPMLTLELNSSIDKVQTDEETNVISGLSYVNDEGDYIEVNAKRFIDATQDADIAVEAGAPYFIGNADIYEEGRLMSATLMIHLENVDWSGVRVAVEEDLFGPADMTESVAWGFIELHREYQPVEDQTRLRGLNLVRIVDEVGNEDFYINALQLFHVDGLDDESKQEAIERGKRETENIVAYLREEFPGFEDAKIASFPEELYIRETRHIESEYMLPMSDIWTHKDHWDGMGMGGYPVDIQATSVTDYGAIVSAPIQYAIPFRSMVPLNVENLLVVSRSAGYSSVAAGSARIIPTGMAVGEASGVAAQIAIEHELTFRELSQNEELIKKVRRKLTDQGANVQSFDYPYPYEGEWFDVAAQELLNLGVIKGGYENDLRVDELAVANDFYETLALSLKRSGTSVESFAYVKTLTQAEKTENSSQLIMRDEVARHLLEMKEEPQMQATGAWEKAHKLELINAGLFERITENRLLTNAEIYVIIADSLKINW